ncbi:dienelactone hydrolase family protein [Chelatococcus sp. SYSU_G07232]|uniref:Dienelactone hydrolase family protein n=1 Tax=Chelatococcus albus TaxID=3047466 RepID=A0ABT7ADF4_9HYPH|nr:dienelactone hydrolase family protein [Chelatococcus sp. SYSU_G07232]MDJ1157408.1 dienelactone hydrolase family protein [Chelatococcus sp. SYSU_G07232]
MALDRRLVELYDEYTHRPLDRRVFLERLMALAGSTAAARAALAALEPNYAQAAVVAETDPRIATRRIAFEGASGRISGYAAWAHGEARRPAVLVIHENRGLNPHIEDIARRLAVDGFLALAVDFLEPFGGTPADADEARRLFAKLDTGSVVNQARTGLGWLKDHERGNRRAGAVGFCWGGGMVNELATRAEELDAGVAYYGRVPDLTRVARIRCPLLLHYAGLDQRINEGVPAYRAALDAAGVPHAVYMYEGVDHAFNNDTSAERYNEAAARLAWSRTLEFLRKTLA